MPGSVFFTSFGGFLLIRFGRTGVRLLRQL